MRFRLALAVLAIASLLATPTAVAEPTDAYRQGGADWRSLQAWFVSQTGDRRAGADYWAGNRSKEVHLSCSEASANYSGDKAEFFAGCQEAKSRLDPMDARRLNEPEYRAGFNSEARQLPMSASPSLTPDQHVTAPSPTPSKAPATLPETVADADSVPAALVARWNQEYQNCNKGFQVRAGYMTHTTGCAVMKSYEKKLFNIGWCYEDIKYPNLDVIDFQWRKCTGTSYAAVEEIEHQRTWQETFTDNWSALISYHNGQFFRCLNNQIILSVTRGYNDENALETCAAPDPRDEESVAAGAIYFMGRKGGAADAPTTPWINAHCTPRVSGYVCEWKGLTINF